MKNSLLFLIIFLMMTCLASCKKYLDEKPDKSLVVPQSIEDLQALLDFSTYMNLRSPSIGEASSDNYFLRPSDYNACNVYQRNAYVWDTLIFSPFPNDWAFTYQPVYFSNIVLDNIDKISRTALNGTAWDNAKGSAFMYRAKSFLTGIWYWAKAYNKNTANTDPAIPLRLGSDFNVVSARSSLEQCYEQIITDLKTSASLLPIVPIHPLRPCRPAAFALLARVYLARGEYDSCLKYAGQCLQLKNDLLDYNTLKASSNYPVPRFNSEVIFHNRAGVPYYNLTIGCIDTVLYNTYAANDLRKTIFFKPSTGGYFTFKGSYDNSLYPFVGIATDEIFLMRAECFARTGNIAMAMNDLNTLLIKRWKSGTFIPYSAVTASGALDLVLTERRKELIWRDLRWMDIKRLNLQNTNISIQRIVNGQMMTLPANDNRFTLPLPIDIVSLTGMTQNPR